MTDVSAADQDRIFWTVSRDLLGIADAAGVWRRVNPAWTAVLGWSEDELVGRTSEWIQHPDDVERTRAERAKLTEGRVTDSFVNRLRTRAGEYRMISWRAVPHGSQMYVIARDVTGELDREQQLHDLQDFSRLALSAVDGVGVWTYDVASDRFTCDRAICELYGIEADEGAAGIGREAFLANVHPDDRAALQATMSKGLEASGDLELEYRLVHPDGTIRSVLSRGHTYFDDDGRPVRRTGVGVETTQRRLLEEQLHQSQKMEAVGQLTGGLAHDFNNLLTAISGSLELIQVRMAQGRVAETDRYLAAAQGAAKRAAALTHRLLAFSRRQTLEPKVTDVDRLVTGMEELIRRTIGPRVTLEPRLATAGVWSTLVDPGQLENALLNLCINARDAMPDGGRLTIETGHRTLDEQSGRERELSPGQYVTLCVSDTGTGMPASVIARAFDPFFTTKPIGMGTGLGLSMVYGFARQSHGAVRIHSEVGHGTMVCIDLPRHRGDTTEEGPPSEPLVAPQVAHHETVLVVDDEPTVRMLVADVLGEYGYRLLEAADGDEALRLLGSDHRIDLLITDVGLPGALNGRQLADAARVGRPTLRVLFITGYAEQAVLGEGRLDRGMRVLTKPFVVSALVERVKALFDER